MAEWVDTGHGDHELIAMDVAAKAWEGCVRVIATVTSPSRNDCESEKAIAAVEVLREAYEVLRERNAPVLRWHRSVFFPGFTASVGDWILEAWGTGWSLRHKVVNPNQRFAFSAFYYDAGEEQARRDVESALRSLGVVFRTEIER